MMENKIKRMLFFITPILIPILFIIFWEIFARKVGNNAVIPQVTTVTKHFININEDVIGIGSIPKNILYSLVRVFIGYVLAIIVALPLGLLVGYFRRTKRALNLFISIFQPVPAIAWRPLVLGWFGVSNVQEVLVESAQVLGASKRNNIALGWGN